MWYDLSVHNQTDAGILSADVYVPSGSAWFEGHFPGNPVLPGIAQLGMVFELISSAFETSLCVREVSRVRFKQMILPGDHLSVTAESKPGRQGVFSFRLTKNDELVCSGNMTVENIV
jgi:3-hydroxyacyl-[acyl-carrier-protein] dehydratase